MKTNRVRKNPYRVILMTLATATVVIFCSQRAWSQTTQLSDSLTVDIGIGGVPTGVPQFAPIPENGPPQQVAIPLPDVLLKLS